jgi:hypothetical protein
MITALFAAFALASSPGASQSAAVQDPVPTDLADVIVEGRVLREEAEAFVDEVAAPARRRGLARWGGRVCTGVVNLQRDLSQALIDHISRVAVEQGLRVGDPGCRPNVVIIFATDAPALASALVEADRRAFHLGVGALDRGKTALEAFQTSEAPVRWWHVSMPVIGGTHQRAVRLPGDSGRIYVPGEGLVNKGRPISDELNKVIIVVDADRLGGANLRQLGEYLSLVALAQVDPDGETQGLDTVLNVFSDPTIEGLTPWDRTYLRALYRAPSERIDSNDQVYSIIHNVRRDRRERERAATTPPAPAD